MIKNAYRKERDFVSIHKERMEQLARCYLALVKNDSGSEGVVLARLLNEIQARDKPNVEGDFEILSQFLTLEDFFLSDKLVAPSVRAPIILAATYLWRAKRAHSFDKRVNAAWSYLADGCYWVGVATASRGVKKARKEERLANASMGAQIRREKYSMVKDHAIFLLRSQMPPGKWENFFDAAGTLDAQINEFAETECGLEPIAAKTIYQWFSKVPDAKSLSQGKRRKLIQVSKVGLRAAHCSDR